jgi:hypothetical protein
MKMQEMESGLCVLFLFSSFSFSFYLFPSSSIMLPFFRGVDFLAHSSCLTYLFQPCGAA